MDEEQWKQEESRKSWDPFLIVPFTDGIEKPGKCLLFWHFVICSVLGLLVCAFGFFSKSSLLMLITVSSQDSTTISNKPFALLILGCVLIVPSVLTFIKCLWKMAFKNSNIPSKEVLFLVCGIELLVSFGTAVLTMIAMPHFDIITNVTILNSVCILPAVLQALNPLMETSISKWALVPPLLSIFFVLTGYVLFFVGYQIQMAHSRAGSKDIYLYIGLAIGSTLLVSLNWWEKFTSFFNTKALGRIRHNLRHSRNITYLISSSFRIVVTGIVVGAYVPLAGEGWSSIKNVSTDTITIVLSLFAIQAISSALCHWFGVTACKMHAFRRGFVLPMIFITPAVFVAFLFMFGMRYKTAKDVSGVGNFSLTLYCRDFDSTLGNGVDVAKQLFRDISHGLCNRVGGQNDVHMALLMGEFVTMWLGLFLSTLYVWMMNTDRIERTTQLYVKPMYEAAFIDQCSLLNIRFYSKEQEYRFKKNSEKKVDDEPLMIYLCATMWHETCDEMIKMFTSLFRLDQYRPKHRAKEDKFCFESHIFFDDAFIEKVNKQTGKKKVYVNEFAEFLVEVFEEVYKGFCKDNSSFKDQNTQNGEHKIMPTPYGGRLCYVLPHGNCLYVHFKNKQRIRHKKRWSQVMYLYYLLGFKLTRKYFTSLEKGESQKNLERRLKKEKHNTYILALDGDVDFQPLAIMLLIDRLKKYPKVGAACGRIHPTGFGPMVWYQKFEYAICHWLQKTAEHVFGCVLCSPGCFSLFRGAALMDDNVMKKYTTQATEAAHHVQYDQGEDRWLCTLLLQQGWRVEYNAASDSYTNAPQEFHEFYNQRRRWGPSTMFNIIDVLNTHKQTKKKNPSISRLYILYQIMYLIASILGPAIVCLMISGCFSFIFNWDPNLCLFLAALPPALYIMVCYKVKTDTQIIIAAIISTVYAFLMSATFIAIIGEMVKQQTFMTPSGLFLIFLVIMFIVTALLHPQEFHLVIYGFLYIICIPSGYLLLNIYSVMNLNNVSWGTREVASKSEQQNKNTKNHNILDKNCMCCGWDTKFRINKYQKITSSTEQQQPLLPQNESQDDDDEVEPPVEIDATAEECWIHQLQEKSGEIEIVEDGLDDDEIPFWEGLIQEYLKPIKEDKAKQDQLTQELRSLRNKIAFVYFFINALWLISTCIIQSVGSYVSIKFKKLNANGKLAEEGIMHIEPFGLLFIVTVAGLLVVQFLAMIYHRLCALTHLMAYIGTEEETKQKPKYELLDPASEFA
ncbi:chitin synthase chs-1-like [Acipenser oxyrinchus oxyrinchus]|uniref:chitin synthase n=1 Tax=Acipenser oxyrinchus oxyrinchus TaxID=40147 RepID=A0AAD8GAY1_ACIOX|nr:chitin synthase chs-1-like [Acipenser oxyrinchus oxyrinchus]